MRGLKCYRKWEYEKIGQEGILGKKKGGYGSRIEIKGGEKKRNRWGGKRDKRLPNVFFRCPMASCGGKLQRCFKEGTEEGATLKDKSGGWHGTHAEEFGRCRFQG